MTKSELRKIYLDRRAALSQNERAAASQRIADRFFDLVDLTPIKYLHCFIPIGKFNEIDTSQIYKQVWKIFSHIRTIAPRVQAKTGDLQNIEFTSDAELVENQWGIREPSNGCVIDPGKIDLVIVPLLCFDLRGHRVGYGRGFYDRFLSSCREDCLKIGVSYFKPEKQIDDLNDHDIPLDLVLTAEDNFQFN